MRDSWQRYEKDVISAKELVSEAKKSVGDRFVELLTLSPKKMKKMGFPIGAAAIPAHAREIIEEDDVTLAKEKHFCVVHKGPIEGLNFICPKCNAYYCLRCYEALKKTDNECWECKTPFDETKPVQKIQKKKKKEKEKEKKPKIKEEIAPKKKPIKDSEIQFEAPPKTPKEELRIKETPKPQPIAESTPKPDINFTAAPSIEKLEKIAKYEEAMEQIKATIQKLDIKFSAGAMSQEDYIAKKNFLAEKLGEVMARIEQLKEE